MSILNRLTQEQIREHFTHYGLFCGIIPVYVGDLESIDGCTMGVRNWWPEWLMDAAEGLFAAAVFVMEAIDHDYEPGWPILLTGEIV